MKEKMDEKWLKTDTPCSQGNPINPQQPQYQQPYSPCQPYAAPNGYAQQRSGLAIASMVLGIVSAAMLFMSLFVSYFITSIISFWWVLLELFLLDVGKRWLQQWHADCWVGLLYRRFGWQCNRFYDTLPYVM